MFKRREPGCWAGTMRRPMGANLAATLAKGWRELVRELRDPYRPELHYMRGPGPKYWARISSEALSRPSSQLDEHETGA
jgi:phytoene dehydrogenase-like protein